MGVNNTDGEDYSLEEKKDYPGVRPPQKLKQNENFKGGIENDTDIDNNLSPGQNYVYYHVSGTPDVIAKLYVFGVPKGTLAKDVSAWFIEANYRIRVKMWR
ncbi:hypothetical protein AKJ62_04085 [candidate division MSBL1 archaeon SCGC-AAA259D14]|uniref:Uncharacterized protein n=1 Tax=candidate division MSBL1 archaeon SCGC-AAA259D14 TaxID=1698261 RepID=A0A133U462_9EURY|nr:hypothetical protein AKJ62_04085 [candidate division MSBL1 archaeon SCGC-AAA259D14]